MALENTCVPVVIYICFSLTQIFIDTYKGLYNVALLKFVLSIIFALLLNFLCSMGLGIISWIIVFVPFIFMSVITAMLIYFFGLDVKTGRLKKSDSTATTISNSLLPGGTGVSDTTDYSYGVLSEKKRKIISGASVDETSTRNAERKRPKKEEEASEGGGEGEGKTTSSDVEPGREQDGKTTGDGIEEGEGEEIVGGQDETSTSAFGTYYSYYSQS